MGVHDSMMLECYGIRRDSRFRRLRREGVRVLLGDGGDLVWGNGRLKVKWGLEHT